MILHIRTSISFPPTIKLLPSTRPLSSEVLYPELLPILNNRDIKEKSNYKLTYSFPSMSFSITLLPLVTNMAIKIFLITAKWRILI